MGFFFRGLIWIAGFIVAISEVRLQNLATATVPCVFDSCSLVMKGKYKDGAYKKHLLI